MIHSNRFQKEVSEFFLDLKLVYGRLILVYLFVIPLCFFRTKWLLTEYRNMGMDVDLGYLDGLATIFGNPYLSVMLAPLFLFLLQGILAYDSRDMVAVRYGSRARLYSSKFKKIAMHAIAYVLSIAVLQVLIGAIFLPFTNTWNATKGIVHTIAQAAVKQDPSSPWLQNYSEYAGTFWYSPLFILGTTLLLAIIGFMAAGMLYVVVEATFNKAVIGYLVLIVLLVIDTFVGKFSILFKQASLDYGEWLSLPGLGWSLFYLVGVSALLYMVGSSMSQKRDYLFAQDAEHVGENR